MTKIHVELEAGMNKLDVLELLEAGMSRAHMANWLMRQEEKIRAAAGAEIAKINADLDVKLAANAAQVKAEMAKG